MRCRRVVLWRGRGRCPRQRRSCTVQQVADRLDVSRATIYRHLDPDKPVMA
ncbi:MULTISPECIES: helix-turn-helix domain-containing protein [unclassified Nonomuraea]|uniref:helix-turn-helix domain-containing protein n=1 Tax=unclassified Nonomuraea TaxID=2593643 RepID=UPI0033C044E9